METIKTYKFRLYPSSATKRQINKTFGCCRFVFNTVLHNIKNKLPKPTERELKIEHPFLKDVDSIALQQSRINLEQAFKNVKEKRANYPRFKSKKSRQSFRTVFTNFNIKIDFENNLLKLPKLNWIKFKDKRKFEGIIKQVTISKDPDEKYYASLMIKEDIRIPEKNTNKTVGIDMGITHYLTLSNGLKVKNPRFFVSLQRKLKRFQRNFSKTKKGSKRREKLRIKIALLHKKITNCRKDFQHKLSNSIIKNFDNICIETLNIKGLLKNKRLAKSFSDLSWSEFSRMLEYKSQWFGKTLLKAEKFFPSSKLCHKCDFKKESLKLSDRIWTCSNCGASHDRDINASLNIIKNTVGTTGIKASGDDVGLKLAFASNAIVYETRSSVL